MIFKCTNEKICNQYKELEKEFKNLSTKLNYIDSLILSQRIDDLPFYDLRNKEKYIKFVHDAAKPFDGETLMKIDLVIKILEYENDVKRYIIDRDIKKNIIQTTDIYDYVIRDDKVGTSKLRNQLLSGQQLTRLNALKTQKAQSLKIFKEELLEQKGLFFHEVLNEIPLKLANIANIANRIREIQKNTLLHNRVLKDTLRDLDKKQQSLYRDYDILNQDLENDYLNFALSVKRNLAKAVKPIELTIIAIEKHLKNTEHLEDEEVVKCMESGGDNRGVITIIEDIEKVSACIKHIIGEAYDALNDG
jgi:hypothetical protein